jgi:hypothetical protein
MKVSISERVAELAQELVESEPAWAQAERPSIEELEEVTIVEDTDGDPYVEVYFKQHLYKDDPGVGGRRNLLIEFFPHRVDYNGLFTLEKQPAVLKTMQKDKLSDEEQAAYEVFAAIVGRLTYFGGDDEA